MSALDIVHNHNCCLEWDEEGVAYPYSVTGDTRHTNPRTHRYATSWSYLTGCWRCVSDVLQQGVFDHFLVIPRGDDGWRVVAGFGEYLSRISDWKPASAERYQLDFRLVPQMRPVQLRNDRGWSLAEQQV